MNYRICIVIPYFGKFPNYFPRFLRSCATNPDIHWLIFTDNDENYCYPGNVRKIHITLSELAELVQKSFSFPVSLHTPYKLCDFRPAYGAIFAEFLKGYDFWGYCDVDLIFGDIRKFVNNTLLSRYDKIGLMGHLSLYRNQPDINELFRTEIDGKLRYQEVLSNPQNFIFDEWDYPSINHIFISAGKAIASLDSIADISPQDSFFRLCRFDLNSKRQRLDSRSRLFCWENGRLFSMWKQGKNWEKEEHLYIHLQKRTMKDNCQEQNAYYIIPDVFCGKELNIERAYSRCNMLKYFNRKRWKYTGHWLRYQIIEKTGPIRHRLRCFNVKRP